MASNIWVKMSGDATSTPTEFQLEVHKKLLNYFQVGDYYYFIFHVKQAEIEFLSPGISDVLGYHPDEVTTAFFIGCIHPEDQPYFLNFENRSGEFVSTLDPQRVFDYKVRYDFRVRHKQGHYVRILHQSMCIQSGGQGHIVRSLCIHTDITQLKTEGMPVLSFIGMNGQPSYYNVAAKTIFTETKSLFTQREREVLELLVNGKTSDEISKTLFISKQTVLSHRKNLLRKSKCSNTSSLCSLAVKNGWV